MPVQHIRERQIEKPKEGSTKYRPEVDGLRAVAIIPVILFHMGYQCTQGGFVGVDVFFVISGYLITSLILKDHDADRFRFPDFWLRRIRRIFPALVVMVIGTSVASYFLMFRGGWNDVGKQGISAILSFANITMWRVTGDYWGSAAHDSVFLHTWSLSVEEQFYFFYPFLIVFLIRFAKKWVFHVISVIAVISFLLYLYGSQYHPGATFYLLPMRAWELATGCLVAIRSWNHDNKISRPASSFLSLGGIVAIIACCLFISGSRNFPGYLFLPVIGSVLIIVSGDSKSSMTNRLLSSSPFVFVGKISYSLYLWHWPILVIAKQMQFMDGSLISTGILLSLIVLVSVVSYYFVEKPTRHRIQILKPAFCALVVSLSISFFLCTARDFYDCSSYNKVLWEGQLYNVNPVNSWPESVKKRMKGVIIPEREISQQNAYKTGGIIKKYGGETPELVVLGDSHALMWSGVINTLCKEMGLTVSFYGADGTSPFVDLPLEDSVPNTYFSSDEKSLFDRKRLDFISEWKPKAIIIVAKWSSVENIEVTRDLIQFIGETGSKVILIEQPPMLFFTDKNAMQYLAFRGITPKENQKQYYPTTPDLNYEKGRVLIQSIVDEYPYCSIVPVRDTFYMADAGAWVLDDSRVLYLDDDHLSQDGALKVMDRIRDEMTRIFVPDRGKRGRLATDDSTIMKTPDKDTL